jgi:hypothetical protein
MAGRITQRRNRNGRKDNREDIDMAGRITERRNRYGRKDKAAQNSIWQEG